MPMMWAKIVLILHHYHGHDQDHRCLPYFKICTMYMLWFSSSLSSIIKTFAKSCGAHPNHHCLPTFTTCTICCGAVACEVVGELKLGQFYPSVHVQRHLVRLISELMTVMLIMRIIMLMIIMFMKSVPEASKNGSWR